jgi:hypothetical protein
MSNRKRIVVTVYGHNKTIDKIAVNLFESPENIYYNNKESNAGTYCDTINSLELKGDSWVFAKLLYENILYAPDALFPLKFSDVILKLDNRDLQKALREINSQDIVKALKGQDESVKEKIFANISKRASRMLIEDMEYVGPVRLQDIKESQKKILDIIISLNDFGAIDIPYYKGEITL